MLATDSISWRDFPWGSECLQGPSEHPPDTATPSSSECPKFTVAGKHLTMFKVLISSQKELSVSDIRILPGFNASYLPVMPGGSVLPGGQCLSAV